jgi:hypothetical protein
MLSVSFMPYAGATNSSAPAHMLRSDRMTAMVTAYQSSVCPDAGREHVTGTLVLPGCHTAGAVTLCSLPGAPPRADSIALSGAARAAKRGDQSASRSIRSIALPPCAMVALEAPCYQRDARDRHPD